MPCDRETHKRGFAHVIVLFVIVVLMVAVGYWFYSNNSATSESQKVVETSRITIADGQQPTFALIYIAESQGFFEEEGLDVNYNYFTSGRDALNNVLEGKSDYATVYETPIVLQASAGEDVRVLTELHNSKRNTGIVAPKENEISTIEDLKGKRIGVVKNSNAEFFLFLTLASNGISLDDITVIDMKPPEMLTSLQDGDIDAAAVWNNHLYDIRRAYGEDNVSVFFSDEYIETSVVATTEEHLSGNSDEAMRLLRALLKAEGYLNENEEEAIEVITNRLEKIPESTIRATWDDFEISLRLSNIFVSILEQEAQWLSDIGLIDTIPDFGNVIASEHLKSINPAKSTIY